MREQDNHRANERVRDRQRRLRAQGLRPIQIWVPDVRSAEFASEAHRQSIAVAASAHAAQNQAFLDALRLEDVSLDED